MQKAKKSHLDLNTKFQAAPYMQVEQITVFLIW